MKGRSSLPPRALEPLLVAAAVDAPYHNVAVTAVNDHEIRMSVMTSGFGWHDHPDSDETFLVLEGRLGVEFEEGEVVLGPGQMLTVPRGVLHRTRPIGERSVNLTFERRDAATVFREAADP